LGALEDCIILRLSLQKSGKKKRIRKRCLKKLVTFAVRLAIWQKTVILKDYVTTVTNPVTFKRIVPCQEQLNSSNVTIVVKPVTLEVNVLCNVVSTVTKPATSPENALNQRRPADSPKFHVINVVVQTIWLRTV